MKKLLMALVISGCCYFSAEAQTLQSIINDLTHFNTTLQVEQQQEQIVKVTPCEISSNKVCKMGSDRKISCYTTKFAENFSVCKGSSGYYICCETPGYGNATHPRYVVVTPAGGNTYTPPSIAYYEMGGSNQNDETNDDINPAIPVSQSYTSTAQMMREREYLGNYPQTHGIRVCYMGDNVAENSRNPYRGCPSPQDDGPDADNQRNEVLPVPENPDFNARLLH